MQHFWQFISLSHLERDAETKRTSLNQWNVRRHEIPVCLFILRKLNESARKWSNKKKSKEIARVKTDSLGCDCETHFKFEKVKSGTDDIQLTFVKTLSNWIIWSTHSPIPSFFIRITLSTSSLLENADRTNHHSDYCGGKGIFDVMHFCFHHLKRSWLECSLSPLPRIGSCSPVFSRDSWFWFFYFLLPHFHFHYVREKSITSASWIIIIFVWKFFCCKWIVGQRSERAHLEEFVEWRSSLPLVWRFWGQSIDTRRLVHPFMCSVCLSLLLCHLSLSLTSCLAFSLSALILGCFLIAFSLLGGRDTSVVSRSLLLSSGCGCH